MAASSTSDHSKINNKKPNPMGPHTKMTKPPAPILSRKMKPQSRFFLNLSGESESCSSAMSSMESVRSSNSGGSVQSLISSSESGAGCSMSSNSNSNLSMPLNCPNKPTLELRTHRSNILSSSKFQVLSPISDKSQEQSSEQGDSSSRTPKVSPTDHILTSCCGVANITDDNENNNPPPLPETLTDPAPFSMPKLQRRLAQQQQKSQLYGLEKSQFQDTGTTTTTAKYYQNSLLKRANSGIQGSDSGISMSSQDVQDMVELLKLPFDMPKLRRKTQHILARPQSMPTQQDQNLRQIENYQDIHNSASNLQKTVNNDQQTSWPGPKPSETGSTMDNYRYHNNWQFNENTSGSTEETSTNQGHIVDQAETVESNIAPPPPGFSDENNQFYLTETTETTSSAEDMEATPSFIKGKLLKKSFSEDEVSRNQVKRHFGVPRNIWEGRRQFFKASLFQNYNGTSDHPHSAHCPDVRSGAGAMRFQKLGLVKRAGPEI